MLEPRASPRDPVGGFSWGGEAHHIERLLPAQIRNGAGIVETDPSRAGQVLGGPAPQLDLLPIDGRRARREIVSGPRELPSERASKKKAHDSAEHPQTRGDRPHE